VRGGVRHEQKAGKAREQPRSATSARRGATRLFNPSFTADALLGQSTRDCTRQERLPLSSHILQLARVCLDLCVSYAYLHCIDHRTHLNTIASLAHPGSFVIVLVMPKNGTATETRGNRAYVEITSISKRQNSMPLKRDARVSESSVRRTLSGRQVYVEIVTPFKSQDARSERSASPTLSRRNLAYVEIASPFKRAPPSQDPGSSVVPVHKRTATRKRGLSDSGAAENQQGGEARKRTKAVENGDHLHSVDDARVGMSPQPNRNDDFPEGSFFCKYRLGCIPRKR
jgi:hypothetical protein